MKKFYKPISFLLAIMLLLVIFPARVSADSPDYSSDTFIESELNDGSIGNDLTLAIYADAFRSDMDSSDYSIVNVPAGLTAVVTRLSSFKVRISLTGKAKNHMSANNIDNLGITFKRSAFVLGGLLLGGLTEEDFKVRFKDSQSARLYYEPMVFSESPANDGTFPGTKYIYLENGKFSDTVFKAGTHYTASNVPAGLTLIAVRVSDSLVRLALQGKAAKDSTSNSVSNVGFSFRDAAFASGGSASSIAQSSRSDIKIQFIDSRPIRVLEVYPSGISGSDNAGIKDLGNTLGSDRRFEITSMSMNRFISMRDELNGNYDAIYFGKGRYVRNGVNENKYGNDITDLIAFGASGKGGITGTGGFVDAGLPLLYHDSALKQDNIDASAGVKTEMSKMLQLPVIKDKVKQGAPASNVLELSDSNKYTKFNSLANTVVANNRRPMVAMADQPVSYLNISQVTVSRDLTFTFFVADTDSPKDAKLKTQLYIDMDHDSMFEDSEIVGSRDTVNGQYETINYTMPAEFSGVYFWKLVTTDAKGAKDEVKDVFRLKGEEMQVKVLQISPDGNQFHLATELNKAVPGGLPGEKYGYRQGEYKINVTEMSVSDFNTNASRKGFTLNGSYNMVVLGFHDNYSQYREFSPDAIKVLQSFIDTKQSVMFTHDSIHFMYNQNLTNAFKDDVGQTKGYTAGLAGFVGGISRPSVLTETIRNTYNLGSNSRGDIYQSVQPYPDTAKLVRPVNSSTLTIYPNNLEALPQSDRKVSDTHYQWFKLDLEDPSVIPLFNLYSDDSGERVNDDAMNNYYIYTKGNITYSGTGHSGSYPYPDYELRLFANTAIKAYTIANQRPVITVSEPDPDSDYIVNKDNGNLQLKFTVTDNEDTAVKYMIEADWDNDGTFETVLRDMTPAVSGKGITEVIKNKESKTTEDYSVRIRAWDSQSPTPAEAEPVIIKITNEDGAVITPSVYFTDLNGNKIEACLAGEKVRIVTTVTAKGRPNNLPEVQTNLDLKAAYSDGSTALNKSYQNAGSYKFYKNSDPVPSSNTYTEEITIEPAEVDDTVMTAKATVSYVINGVSKTQTADGRLDVINGSIDVRVKDDQDKPVSNVAVKYSGNVVGMTGQGGSCVINRVIGQKQYQIEIPAGYELKAVNVYKYVDGNPNNRLLVPGNAANVTLNDYKWEIEYKIAYKADVDVGYYRLRSNEVVLLGNDMPGMEKTYTLASQVNAPAKYTAVVTIGAIGTSVSTGSSLNVTGIEFTLETLDKNGDVVSTSSAAGIDSTRTSLNGLPSGAVQLLNAMNSTPPPSGTYASGIYYVIIGVNKADGQTVQIKEITLYMSNGSKNHITLNNKIRFVVPSPPLMR